MIQKLLDFILSLFGWGQKHDCPDPPCPSTPQTFDSSWLKLAKEELGVAEIKGEKHNPRVVHYFMDAGHGWVKDDETAWCAAFVGAMLERSGTPSAKSLAARSYLTWGKPLKKPKKGCIVVFSRGNPHGWQGHVGFYMGETKTHIKVLGGNQSNKVSIASYPKSRLLGYRWPVTALTSRTNVAGVAGATASAGTGIAIAGFSIAETLDIARTMQSLGDFWWLIFVALGISSVCHLVSVWARADDLKKKGR